MGPLRRLVPVSEGYAALPVSEAFNWDHADAGLGAGPWYLVAFRSVRSPGADEERLAHFDDLAHHEAEGAPGFIHYFKGPAAGDGSCLSFCLWETREDARAAAAKPAHREAVSLINEMYASYVLEYHRVARGAEGRLTFEPYRHSLEVKPSHEPAASTAPIFSIEPSTAS